MARPDKEAVLLLSGGLDSASLLFWLLKRDWHVFALHVDYGQVTEPSEWTAAQTVSKLATAPTPVILSVPEITNLVDGTLVEKRSRGISEYFPSRNLLLLTIATIYAYRLDVTTVMLGLVAGTSSLFPDTSPAFISSVENTFRTEHSAIELITPLIEQDKMQIVVDAMECGLQPELTFSCNSMAQRHCWQCSSCLDRLKVFKALDII